MNAKRSIPVVLLLGCVATLLMCPPRPDVSSPRATARRRAQVAELVKARFRGQYGFEVRGPLTLTQFADELKESYAKWLELARQVGDQNAELVSSSVKSKCDRITLLTREGDELYFFTSDRRSWGELAGKDGYVLVRKDKIVDLIIRNSN